MAEERVERAAGGFVVRRRGSGREVLLIDDAYGRVSFPKGHLEPGETWEDAAVREVREETGILSRILAPLGRVEYLIERDGAPVRKQVRLFLMEEIDEQDEPSYQAEEVRGAYFLPWDEADRRHRAQGYENWSWVFAKADALWRWHESRWETRLRGVSNSADAIDAVWNEVSPLLDDLVAAVARELSVVAPALHRQAESPALPREVEAASLPQAIEHTLLKPEASQVDVENLCRDAARHGFHAVCVNPQHVGLARRMLDGTGVAVCTVIGFPLGAADPVALVAEAEAVVQAGAVEIDMVIPVGSMREDDIWTVHDHVRRVCEAAHRHPGVTVKTILETHFLTASQVCMASMVAAAAGADLVKTSTGFAPTGARIADVAMMALSAGGRGVKAAGGVRTRADALAMMRFGATRIGTSSGVAMLRQ
ncbi:deoxyribose-phosphate aldolase [Alicyclobacillus sp.]|uniref:deoxyribose-phosphate aldolase n=1 Tax=Alicyclobacillus sp. TaxID=61169 RepID=UPI0025BADC60|nr:deoxyribose-phosphate aldolase [Alicyclobacillus sp.]MCL6516348.1 deoxyribose-phosphate aldolase [Alicyclobacillus sp.]